MTAAVSKKTTRRERILRYAPFLLWIGVIFFLSSEQGSMAQTSRFILPVLHILFPSVSDETLRIYHGYIRKSAHFTEYAILALLAFRAIYAREGLRKYNYLLPVLLVFVIACLDEFNQSFEASRTSSFRDVLLDLSGAVVAMAVVWIFCRRRRQSQL